MSHRKHSPGDAVASSWTPSVVPGGASRVFVPLQGLAGFSFPRRAQPGFRSLAGPSRAFVPQVVHIDDPQRAELRLKQGLPPTDFV